MKQQVLTPCLQDPPSHSDPLTRCHCFFCVSDCPPLPPSLGPLGLVPSVGVGYGLRYVDPASSPLSERLVFEAASRPGKGRLIFTSNGLASEELSRMAQCAMEWAMVSLFDHQPTSIMTRQFGN